LPSATWIISSDSGFSGMTRARIAPKRAAQVSRYAVAIHSVAAARRARFARFASFAR
jgi:hypothetical protein